MMSENENKSGQVIGGKYSNERYLFLLASRHCQCVFSQHCIFHLPVMEWKSYLPLIILAVDIVILWIFFILASCRNRDVSLIQLRQSGGGKRGSSTCKIVMDRDRHQLIVVNLIDYLSFPPHLSIILIGQ